MVYIHNDHLLYVSRCGYVCLCVLATLVNSSFILHHILLNTSGWNYFTLQETRVSCGCGKTSNILDSSVFHGISEVELRPSCAELSIRGWTCFVQVTWRFPKSATPLLMWRTIITCHKHVTSFRTLLALILSGWFSHCPFDIAPRSGHTL